MNSHIKYAGLIYVWTGRFGALCIWTNCYGAPVGPNVRRIRFAICIKLFNKVGKKKHLGLIKYGLGQQLCVGPTGVDHLSGQMSGWISDPTSGQILC